MSPPRATRRCSFCNRERKAHEVFTRQDVRICGSCVAIASKIFEHGARGGEHRKSSGRHCSFCRKSEAELTMLCAGPDVEICDACASEAAGTATGPRSALGELMSAILRRVRSWRGPGASRVTSAA